MHSFPKYWSYIAKRAWADSWPRIASAVAVLVLMVLAAFGLHWIGVDKLTAGVLAVLTALGIFVARMLVIPPRLHEAQLERADHLKAAKDLEQLWEEGRRLASDSGAGATPWANQQRDWEAKVAERLALHNAADVATFRMTAFDLATSIPTTTNAPAPQSKERHEAKLDALKTIVTDAYRSGAPNTPVP